MEEQKGKRPRGRPATGQAKPRAKIGKDYRRKKEAQGLTWLATYVPSPLAARLKELALAENLTVGHIIDRYIKLPE